MNVFLVEDSQVILARLRAVAAAVPGIRVIADSGGQDDAVARILASRPDIVVLDLSLTDGSGIEVLRRTRPLLPAMKVIILTNRSQPQYRKKCMALGADRFLDKSRDFERVAGLLAEFASAAG